MIPRCRPPGWQVIRRSAEPHFELSSRLGGLGDNPGQIARVAGRKGAVDGARHGHGGKPWASHRDIWARHQLQKNSEADGVAAIEEWASQPSLAAIISATRIAKPTHMQLSHCDVAPKPGWWNERVTSKIDRLLLSRARYVAAHGPRLALFFCEIIRDGSSCGLAVAFGRPAAAA